MSTVLMLASKLLMTFTFVIQKGRTSTGCQNNVVIVGDVIQNGGLFKSITEYY